MTDTTHASKPRTGAGSSPWAPFASKAFTLLWVAQLVSNLGSWMQTVGAQWFLVEQSHSPALVAWVQTASLLPVLLLSLLAGVAADALNRRLLLVVLNAGAAVVAGVLAVLAASRVLDPTSLLGLTFVLGCLGALAGPAWQAIQPELVPRDELTAASSLGSVTVNGARAIGPALAGIIVAASGPGLVFALNAVSFLVVTVALVVWRRPRSASSLPREPFTEAIASGLRYVRAAPGVRRVLLRAGLFVLPGSAFWALLPSVSNGRLRLGAGGYGLLLGSIGVGSIIGVVVLPLVRRHLSSTWSLALSAVVFGAGTVATALAPLPVVVVLLLVMGVAWIVTLTILNATLQLTVASWVRARALAVYLVVFLGGQGVGAFVWGLVAQWIGTPAALLVASGLLGLAAVSVPLLPLGSNAGTLDRTVVALSDDGPALVFAPDDQQPVTAVIAYRVEAVDLHAFASAIRRVELSRRRTGAYLWKLERHGTDAGEYREEFTVRSWAEYQRAESERWTGYDAEGLDAVKGWVVSQDRWFPLSPAGVARPTGASSAAPGHGDAAGDSHDPRA